MKKMLKLFVLLVFVIAASSTGRVFAYNQWTWYIYSTNVVSGTPGYIDVTIGIKAKSSTDEAGLGNHAIWGTTSSDLYNFGVGHDPELQTNHLDATNTTYAMSLVDPNSVPNDWNLATTYSGGTGSGVTVTTGGILVATIRFYIKNSSGTSGIDLGSTQSTYEDNNTTLVTVSYDNTGGDVSLPVQMTALSAAASKEEGIILHWRTESEADCAGFHVWRSETEPSLYNRITTSLIPAEGNSSTATDYTFTDKNVHDGTLYWYKVEEVSTEGESKFFGPISVTGINPIPTEFALSQNYPNPFNPETTFGYQLPEECSVSIKVYTLLGQEVKNLVEEHRPGGHWTAEWNGTDNFGRKLPSGIYLLRMKAGSYTQIRKMTLTR